MDDVGGTVVSGRNEITCRVVYTVTLGTGIVSSTLIGYCIAGVTVGGTSVSDMLEADKA